jgi:hypothetical protein
LGGFGIWLRIDASTSAERPSALVTLRVQGGVSDPSVSEITGSISCAWTVSASGTFWRTWLISSGIEIVPRRM